MSHNERSRHITHGVARAPNRAMYYALGYQEADFDNPMIGVANGHSTITPCNSGLQRLADAAIEAIRGAKANPQVFGTPTISDGMSMGTEGMKYSLVSREVIADCIETAAQGQWMDGVVVIGGCDKNMPGGMIALARMNVPGIYVYGGTIKPGRYQGKDLTIVSVFEAVGEFTMGRMQEADFKQIEKCAIPGSGSCGGMYTANTMSSAFEAMGMSLPYSSTMANEDDEKVASAAESARVLVDAVRRGLRPRDIITRESIENAVSVIMATGGSTNAVLHFLAIAHAAEVPWTIDDFERIRQRVPVLCDLKPSGRYVATDLHRAGGIPQVMKLLLNAGLLHGDCITISGQTVAQTVAGVPDSPRPDQDVIMPLDRALYPQGHLAILKGNLSPEGCVAKITGLKNPVITGPARVFDSEDDAMAAIMARQIHDGDVVVIRYEGPKGGGRHARNAGAHLRAGGPGAGRNRRPHHRRPFLRRHLGHGGGPRRTRSVRRRPDRTDPRGRFGYHQCPPAAVAAQYQRRRDGGSSPGLGSAQAALYTRCACQVRQARQHREPWGSNRCI